MEGFFISICIYYKLLLMKKTIRIKESELVSIIKRIIKEGFEDDLKDTFEDGEYIDQEDEVQDFGFDYEEEYDDVDDFESIKRKKNIKPAEHHGRSEWRKEWEKPYSPIKPTDLPLDKFLASRKSK